jgi:hypothetical protein
MMRAVMWRELSSILREPRFLAVMAARLAVLGAFVLVWGDGIPVLRGYTVLEQMMMIDVALLSAALPWIAVRCSPDSCPNDLVVVSVAASSPPWQVLAARIAGGGAALLACVLSALPLVVLAQQISAAPVSATIGALAPSLATPILAATTASLAMLLVRDRLLVWLVATALTVLGAGANVLPQSGLRLLVTAVVALGLLVLLAERRLKYLGT